MNYAEQLLQEGEKKGIQLGVQQAQQEIARQLLKAGVDRNIVANATHLTSEQVNKLNKLL